MFQLIRREPRFKTSLLLNTKKCMKSDTLLYDKLNMCLKYFKPERSLLVRGHTRSLKKNVVYRMPIMAFFKYYSIPLERLYTNMRSKESEIELGIWKSVPTWMKHRLLYDSRLSYHMEPEENSETRSVSV